MNERDGGGRLESMAASELRAVIDEVSVGAELTVAPSLGLCSTLEHLFPELLSRRYPEWASETLDGVFVELARRVGADAARLGGACILMTDQTVTPFLFDVTVDPAGGSLASFHLLLGEPGRGRLGISGPGCSSFAATLLRARIPDRLDTIDWSFEVASDDNRP
jgi:hypothetical protein